MTKKADTIENRINRLREEWDELKKDIEIKKIDLKECVTSSLEMGTVIGNYDMICGILKRAQLKSQSTSISM